jgi:hypothetical protein
MTTFRTNSKWAGWVDHLVGTIYSALKADIHHGDGILHRATIHV